MKLTFAAAKRLCGLEVDLQIKGREDYEYAMGVCKARLVAARNSNDDDLAKVLSQCRQLFKQRFVFFISHICPRCGDYKNPYAIHCNMCARIERYYRNMINSTSAIKEHELELGTVLIPPRCHQTGVLTATLRKMATEGQVGDSTVTDKHSTSIKNVARSLGMEVIVRIANPEQTDKAKRRYRVWRSDGLQMDEVNELIRKRLKGEAIPAPKPCVPPPKPSRKKGRRT